MPKRGKAPAGCYWREGVLWGRVKVRGRERRWSLQTDDTGVARARRKAGKDRLIAATVFGDARLKFSEAIADWAPWVVKHVSANTAKRYLVSMGMLEPFLDGLFLDEVDGKLVAKIIRDRQRNDDVTNATIKRDLVALSSIMNFAVLQGWIEINPVLPKMKLVKERRDPIALPEEYSIAAMTARAPGMFSSLISAARVTGAREEELASGRRSQLDLKAKRLTIIKGKGSKTRVVDLGKLDGHKVFAALPAGIGDAFLFWHGNGARYENVSSRFATLSRELAENDPLFKPFRFHDLRHLHAVEYLRAGGTIYDLQQRLGHASIKTTEEYLRFLTPEEQRAAKGESRATFCAT